MLSSLETLFNRSGQLLPKPDKPPKRRTKIETESINATKFLIQGLLYIAKRRKYSKSINRVHKYKRHNNLCIHGK